MLVLMLLLRVMVDGRVVVMVVVVSVLYRAMVVTVIGCIIMVIVGLVVSLSIVVVMRMVKIRFVAVGGYVCPAVNGLVGITGVVAVTCRRTGRILSSGPDVRASVVLRCGFLREFRHRGGVESRGHCSRRAACHRRVR